MGRRLSRPTRPKTTKNDQGQQILRHLVWANGQQTTEGVSWFDGGEMSTCISNKTTARLRLTQSGFRQTAVYQSNQTESVQ